MEATPVAVVRRMRHVLMAMDMAAMVAMAVMEATAATVATEATVTKNNACIAGRPEFFT